MSFGSVGWRLPDPSERSTRTVAGVSLGRRSGRCKAVLVTGSGEGWNFRVVQVAALTEPPPDHVSHPVCGTLVRLAEQAGVALADIQSVGIASPLAGGEVVALAEKLALRTGATVVHSFAARDRALGGSGELLGAVPRWLLYGDPRRRRLVVEVGRTVRVTCLPPASDPQRTLAFDAAPGGVWLDALFERLSDGRGSVDPSGHHAVQGSCNDRLLGQWMSHPFLLRPPPRLLAADDFPPELLDTSLAFARELHLSAADVLCTAVHFVAAAVREAVQRFALPPGVGGGGDAYLAGGGLRHGLLRKRLGEALPDWRVAESETLGYPGDAHAALDAALLALCRLDHLPVSIPALTGASQPAVLGQVVPGATANWDRWVCQVADRFIDQAERRAA